MAENATSGPPPRRFDLREAARIAAWGLGAAGAVALFAYVSTSETGNERMLLALAQQRGLSLPEPAPLQVAQAAPAADDSETRALYETVRSLTTEGERLRKRIETLERNVEDMTGSIARVASRAVAPPVPPQAMVPQPLAQVPPEPAPAVSAPATVASPLPSFTAPLALTATPANVWANVPLPRSAPQGQSFPPVPTPYAATHPEAGPSDRPEFGIDLGLAPTMEGLRALWNAVRGKHASQLEGLRPIVVLRERNGGGVDMRLVVGPLPSAAAAARLCAMLGSVSATCQPAEFEGQRLALR